MKKFLRMSIASLLLFISPNNYLIEKSYSTQTVKIIYIDNDFSNTEIRYIKMAANEWENESKKIIKFEFVNNKDEAEYLEKIKYKYSELPVEIINFKKISNEDKITLFLDKEVGGKIVGFYDDESRQTSILLVTDRLDSLKKLKSIILHEIGHSLGLKHIKHKNTIMHSTQSKSSDDITIKDLEEFCNLYYCEPLEN